MPTRSARVSRFGNATSPRDPQATGFPWDVRSCLERRLDERLLVEGLPRGLELRETALGGAEGRSLRRAESAQRIDASVEGQQVRIDVTDTGAGMDEEALERVFEPYFSTKATGTGLGLPIARRNIELNGGSIDVRSERGKGTTVTMRLPLADGPSA